MFCFIVNVPMSINLQLNFSSQEKIVIVENVAETNEIKLNGYFDLLVLAGEVGKVFVV